MTLTLRYMQLPDITQVTTIDRASFDPPWSTRSYTYEVSESSYSHMVVLEQEPDKPPPTGIKRLVQNLSRPHNEEKTIVGYGGLWHIVDEAHISTIATHPDYRGRGWGEVLLAGMIQRSITVGAAYVVLEVRVSNTVAQNLYRKYSFEVTTVKPHYYHSNDEDAYDMRVRLDNPQYVSQFQERYRALQERIGFHDLYTTVKPPRDSEEN